MIGVFYDGINNHRRLFLWKEKGNLYVGRHVFAF